MSAAVDVDDLASDIGGGGEEKKQGLFDFVCICPALHGDILDDVRIYIPIYGRENGA